MKKYATATLKNVATFLEIFISLMLAFAIALLSLRLAGDIFNIFTLDIVKYEALLASSLNLVIGVELIRMIYTHSPGTVFEVLLFAIARQIIIEHSSATSSLIGVISICILFATRKYFFIDFDESEKILFRGSQKVHHINKLLHVNIPHRDGQTLAEVIIEKLDEEKEDIGVGACTYYHDFGLHIVKMKEDVITRVEVIRSIH